MVVIRYEGPKGGPGMQETRQEVRALVTDGRFSGGTIGLLNDGASIEIDIPNRRIHLAISDAEMAKRRTAMEARGAAAWKPQNRARKDSAALQAYAAMTTSADTGPAAEDRDKVVPSLTRAEIR